MASDLIMCLILFILIRGIYMSTQSCIYVLLLFLILLLLDFIRLIIINSIIVGSLHNLKNKKSLLMKSSLFSVLAIFVTVIICTILFSLWLFQSNRNPDIISRITLSLSVGFISNVAIGSSNNFDELIILTVRFIVTAILIYCFHKFIVYKNLELSKSKKRILLLISTVSNSLSLLLLPIMKIGFVDDIVDNIMMSILY